MTYATVLVVNTAATLFMTGLIWFAQVVHYPLFGAVGRDGFASYEESHARLTTFVVGPPMLVEAATALLLAALRPHWTTYTGLALLAFIWLSTALLQVPAHNALGSGFDAVVHSRLVSTNWIRTVCWTIRAVLCLTLLQRHLRVL